MARREDAMIIYESPLLSVWSKGKPIEIDDYSLFDQERGQRGSVWTEAILLLGAVRGTAM